MIVATLIPFFKKIAPFFAKLQSSLLYIAKTPALLFVAIQILIISLLGIGVSGFTLYFIFNWYSFISGYMQSSLNFSMGLHGDVLSLVNYFYNIFKLDICLTIIFLSLGTRFIVFTVVGYFRQMIYGAQVTAGLKTLPIPK